MLSFGAWADFPPRDTGLKGKMYAKKRHAEKALMKKTIAMHEERDNKHKADDGVPQNAVPAYLLEREQVREHAWVVDALLMQPWRGIQAATPSHSPCPLRLTGPRC